MASSSDSRATLPVNASTGRPVRAIVQRRRDELRRSLQQSAGSAIATSIPSGSRTRSASNLSSSSSSSSSSASGPEPHASTSPVSRSTRKIVSSASRGGIVPELSPAAERSSAVPTTTPAATSERKVGPAPRATRSRSLGSEEEGRRLSLALGEGVLEELEETDLCVRHQQSRAWMLPCRRPPT